MSVQDDYPVLQHWRTGGSLEGFLGDSMEVEVNTIFREVDRLRNFKAGTEAVFDKKDAEIEFLMSRLDDC